MLAALSFLLVVDPCTILASFPGFITKSLGMRLALYTLGSISDPVLYAQQTSANTDKHLRLAQLVCSWLVWPTLDQILPTPTAMNHVIVQVLVSLRA